MLGNDDAKSILVNESDEINTDSTVFPTILSDFTRNRKEIQISFELAGQSIIIELVPNINLMNKHSTIEYLNMNKRNIINLNISSRIYCHYYGKIKDYENSIAALSICNGLVFSMDYFILSIILF